MRSKRWLWVLMVFFAVFFLVGAGVFHLAFVRPGTRVWQARAWEKTPCAIVVSRLVSFAGRNSTTHRVEILYSYQVAGRDYKSSRYGFVEGSSGDMAAQNAIVERYPAGSEAYCYVNPREPTESVIERRFTRELWFGFIPLIFVVAGAGGMLFAWRNLRRLAPSRFEKAGFNRGSSAFLIRRK